MVFHKILSLFVEVSFNGRKSIPAKRNVMFRYNVSETVDGSGQFLVEK